MPIPSNNIISRNNGGINITKEFLQFHNEYSDMLYDKTTKTYRLTNDLLNLFKDILNKLKYAPNEIKDIEIDQMIEIDGVFVDSTIEDSPLAIGIQNLISIINQYNTTKN